MDEIVLLALWIYSGIATVFIIVMESNSWKREDYIRYIKNKYGIK
tara:strand:- start:2769 stop:2903 length:135 start_codon:yes stop_codon:yes gene_type:complete